VSLARVVIRSPIVLALVLLSASLLVSCGGSGRLSESAYRIRTAAAEIRAVIPKLTRFQSLQQAFDFLPGRVTGFTWHYG
jgi:hypothetical protein